MLLPTLTQLTIAPPAGAGSDGTGYPPYTYQPGQVRIAR